MINNNIRYPLWLNTVGLCAIAGHGCPKTEDHCPTCSAPDDGDRNQFRQGPRELDSLGHSTGLWQRTISTMRQPSLSCELSHGWLLLSRMSQMLRRACRQDVIAVRS